MLFSVADFTKDIVVLFQSVIRFVFISDLSIFWFRTILLHIEIYMFVQ
jgi:hypothetical protein